MSPWGMAQKTFVRPQLLSANPDPDLPTLYESLGDIYRVANQQAYEECGSDYSSFSCICPKAQVKVLTMVNERFKGQSSRIPGWLQQDHCPSH
jgi:hypothetical protein